MNFIIYEDEKEFVNKYKNIKSKKFATNIKKLTLTLKVNFF